MKTLQELQEVIAKKIDIFCSENHRGNIYQPINYIMKLGGKRLRPALALMSANLFTDDLDDVIFPALGFEVFHNFTLMHDDIMDNAPLRRGQPTVHEKWNRDAAILSGDAMLIQSYQLLMKTRPQVLAEILELFNTTALEVCEGQQLDMEFQSRSDVAIAEYLEMIRLKTSVLLAGAMKTGALIANADPKSQHDIYEFAIQLGLSFQLWDDYLDAFGDQTLTGKQTGGDILADKKTFLLLRSYEKAGRDERIVLDQYVGYSNQNSAEKVNAILAIYRQLQVDQELIDLVDRFHSTALEILDKLDVEPERKKLLRNLALNLKGRNF